MVTLLSAMLIMVLVVSEFIDYRRIETHTQVLVDERRGSKLDIFLNITFPHIPCHMISLDVIDQSGESMNDVSHSMYKNRLSSNGEHIESNEHGELGEVLEHNDQPVPEGYCGDCYGGKPDESGCCNTCESVREAYIRQGWSFSEPQKVEQCEREHFSENLELKAHEGCNFAGTFQVNKVAGNFHLAPGKSFQSGGMHMHDVNTFFVDPVHHDFTHHIHELRFGPEIKKGLIKQPLNGISKNTVENAYNFLYFIKTVSTIYVPLGKPVIESNQYGVTSHERPISGGPDKDKEHTHAIHARGGLPG